jgi:hypothetical protein
VNPQAAPSNEQASESQRSGASSHVQVRLGQTLLAGSYAVEFYGDHHRVVRSATMKAGQILSATIAESVGRAEIFLPAAVGPLGRGRVALRAGDRDAAGARPSGARPAQ